MRNFWEKIKRHAGIIAFLCGFITDNLTLRRVDLLPENIIFLSFLVISAIGIIIYNVIESKRPKAETESKISTYITFVIQFCFGGLLSGFFVFYSRSGTLAGSWPFLLFLLGLLLGNEIFKKKYAATTFQVSVFFVAAFSYSIFILPVLIGRIGPEIFLLSGVLALLILRLLIIALKRFSPERYLRSKLSIIVGIILLYISFNILYFTNTIPPIPLSLKEIGVYHSVARNGEIYEVSGEKVLWYRLDLKWRPIFHKTSEAPVYVYSSVFAPTRLSTEIFHEWWRWSENTEVWKKEGRVGFQINGGRDEGYRGYSVKTGVKEGKWRVDVLTSNSALIGRIIFMVEDSEESPKLYREIK